MKKIGYARCSTEEQSLEVQNDALRKYGCVAVFCDQGVSGSVPFDNRPNLIDAVDALEAGDELVVMKRDRLARDVEIVAVVKYIVSKRGALVRFLDTPDNAEGPIETLMGTIMDAFAAYERALIRGRIREHFRKAKEDGDVFGRPPIGYRLVNKQLVEVPDELNALTLAKIWVQNGMSKRKAVERLNKEFGEIREWKYPTIARHI